MTTSLTVPICVLPHGQKHPLPKYETPQSAGMDLFAAIEATFILEPGKRTIVPTGISCALRSGYEAQIRSRSGLSAKHGVIVLNAPGTVDADYRGEIKVILINLGQESFSLEPGMRIAQLVISSFAQISWTPVSTLDTYETQRGAGGFGSTGI